MFNSFSRAGLTSILGLFLFFTVVSAAPLLARENGLASSLVDARVPPQHATPGPLDTPRGIIHHTSCTPDEPIQVPTPENPTSIFKRDMGELVFPVRRNWKSKLKKGFKKFTSEAKHFVQENKNKIAKVGLKVLSMAEKYGSKALSAVPVIGKPLSKGLEIASKFTDKASNNIHANLGGKLGEAMEGMEKAEQVADYMRR